MHKCDRITGTVYRMDGVLGEYVRNVSEQWLTTAPRSNPAMLEMFRDRDRPPLRDMVMWAGEYAGKYLTSAVQTLRLTGDAALREVITDFVSELVSLQADDGYLGPWPAESALKNSAANCMRGAPLWNPTDGGDTWDAWGHYHITLGLLLWHADTGEAAALDCARRMADRLCEIYHGGKSPRLVETGWSEVNLAPAHSLAMLHKVTGEARYLELAEQIVAEFAACDDSGNPVAGNYLEGTLAGSEFFELPNTRWESLHPIMALAELYTITGNEEYGDAFERIWWSIAATDRHNNGGFTTVEQACGDPYAIGQIETCCTIAWIALSVEMLRLTGDARVADEIELSVLNSVIGLHSVSGRWVTYSTPPDGKRQACGLDLWWQGREGSSELSCCSVNGPRGLGMVSDWALMKDHDGLLLNWYGPSEMAAPLDDTVDVTLRQTTDYPRDGRVRLNVDPTAPTAFCLKLRVPRWATHTTVIVNGESVTNVQSGTYLAIDRTWQSGDVIELDLGLPVHFWSGHNVRAGKTSVYRGPILLTYDRRYNDMAPDDVPALDARQLDVKPVAWPHWLPPAILLECAAADGRKLRLCDFGSAGETGTPYKSWLDVDHVDARRPQFFAPPPDRRLRAEIGRQTMLYQAYVGKTDTDARRRPMLIQLLREWPAFVENCASARAVIEADPDTPAARSLAVALARIPDEADITDPAAPDRLQQQIDQLVAAPACTLTDWRVSELQPPLDDIRRAELLPDANIAQPIEPQGGSVWPTVDGVHLGRPGTVYIRTTVKMPRTERARLMYGADGPVKLWVNGREADCRPDPTAEPSPESNRTLVDWVEGDNTLVFAVDTNDGKTKIGVHVSMPSV